MASHPVSVQDCLDELTRTRRGPVDSNDAREVFLTAARRALGDVDVTLTETGEVQVTQLVDGQRVVVACEQVSQDADVVARFHALHDALNVVALSYFPGTVFPAGSLGALLQSDGAWARGVSVTVESVTVTLEHAFLHSTRLRPTSEWTRYGFTLRVLLDGRERTVTFDREDHVGNIDGWARLPTSPAARATLEVALGALARQVCAEPNERLEDILNGYTGTSTLLTSLVQPAAPGSLLPWLQQALPRLLDGHVHVVGEQTFRVVEVLPPQVGLDGFGLASLRLSRDDGEDEDFVSLGALGPAALDLPAPRDGEELRDVEALVSRFVEWLDVNLDAVGLRFSGYFPLVSLIERRLLHGPPGAPPVPPPAPATLARAGAALAPLEEEGCIAAWSINGWKVLLHDDLGRRPFSEPGLSLVPPEGGAPCVVMMCDAWNPEARAVIDGDAFAFRRFLAWLRGAVLASDHDPELVFELDEDDRDEDEPEEMLLTASDWLLFGMPDLGDRFLVDWRAQWHVVRASAGVEAFAGIYGFTGEKLEQLLTRDAPTWRRFLREQVDPRFGA